MRVHELAEKLSTPFEGNGEAEISAAAPIESAGPQDLSFIGNRKALEQAPASAAGCLIAGPDFPNASARTILRSPHPRAAFAAAIGLLYPKEPVHPGIHHSANIAASAEIHPTSSIAANVTIGEHVEIGARSCIGPGCVVGDRSSIGEDCTLHANVTIYHNVNVGNRVILHSGCVLGADGFGFALVARRYEKFPQIGRVSIGDDVEIGANSCVDRAALGVTAIAEGCKLDNMVHIGHNCAIGRHVVVAAQTGLSGGVTVGDYAVIGGQVGIGDKARIEPGAVLGSGCGVLTSKIVRSGQVVWGTPARPLKDYLRQLANLSRLEALRKEVAALKQKLSG